MGDENHITSHNIIAVHKNKTEPQLIKKNMFR